MSDDDLEAAWLSFAKALADNERSKIRRDRMVLTERRSLLADFGQARPSASMLDYQRRAMNAPAYTHCGLSGVISVPLRFVGL